MQHCREMVALVLSIFAQMSSIAAVFTASAPRRGGQQPAAGEEFVMESGQRGLTLLRVTAREVPVHSM